MNLCSPAVYGWESWCRNLISLLSGGFSFLKLLKELRNEFDLAFHPGVNAWATENFRRRDARATAIFAPAGVNAWATETASRYGNALRSNHSFKYAAEYST